MIEVYYNGLKFKYQPTSGTGWFSYKIWTKNSKTPIVNLFKNLRPFQNYIFKIQWEIHFLTFSNTDWNAPKKRFRIEIWTFSFIICFLNQFSTSGSGQTGNTQIHVSLRICWFNIVYGRNQSGCEKVKNGGFLPFILCVFLTIYICVALMKLTMCFKQLEASYALG